MKLRLQKERIWCVLEQLSLESGKNAEIPHVGRNFNKKPPLVKLILTLTERRLKRVYFIEIL
jgi:hypothetical protein